MRVLGVFLIGMVLQCTVSVWSPKRLSKIVLDKFFQRDAIRHNRGKYQEHCSEHCSCYTTVGHLVKVKCNITTIPKMSNWTICYENSCWKPKHMLVYYK